MKDAYRMVAEFHRAFGVDAPDAPRALTIGRLALRFSLIEEECHEFCAAANSEDMDGIAKELADIVYVVIGTAVEYGLVRFDEIFAEVHRSNMSKLGPDGKPIYRPDGKVMKGDNYSPPDLTELVKP